MISFRLASVWQTTSGGWQNARGIFLLDGCVCCFGAFVQIGHYEDIEKRRVRESPHLSSQVVIVFYFVLLQTTMAAAQNEVREPYGRTEL